MRINFNLLVLLLIFTKNYQKLLTWSTSKFYTTFKRNYEPTSNGIINRKAHTLTLTPQKTSFTATGEDAPSLTIQVWKPWRKQKDTGKFRKKKEDSGQHKQ